MRVCTPGQRTPGRGMGAPGEELGVTLQGDECTGRLGRVNVPRGLGKEAGVD